MKKFILPIYVICSLLAGASYSYADAIVHTERIKRSSQSEKAKNQEKHIPKEVSKKEKNNAKENKSVDEEKNKQVKEEKKDVIQTDSIKSSPVTFDNKDVTASYSNHLPNPMTFSEVVLYQKKYPEDIHYSQYKTKDKFGNKNEERIFDFLGDNGAYHGNGIVSNGKIGIRLTISYGFANIPSSPVAALGWCTDWSGWTSLSHLNFVFESGYEREIPLQGYSHQLQERPALLTYYYANYYWGIISLNSLDVYDLSHHGNLAAVQIVDASGGYRHVFYSGDKDAKTKEKFTKGLKHVAKILDINEYTIADLQERNLDLQEAHRKEQLRKEVLREIEREEMKKEILSEREAKK